MDIDSCYQVGYVIKKHGLKGDVRISLLSSLPKKLESIFVEINGSLVPFFIEHISVLEDQAILKLEEVDNLEEANKLAKCRLFLPNKQNPKSSPKSHDFTEIVGFDVYFKNDRLGIITDINQHALNPLLIIKKGDSELLIPINDYFIKAVDYESKKVDVSLPDGFTEI